MHPSRYTIVILIAFEVIVEMHAMGWLELWPPPPPAQVDEAPQPTQFCKKERQKSTGAPETLRRRSSGMPPT